MTHSRFSYKPAVAAAVVLMLAWAMGVGVAPVTAQASANITDNDTAENITEATTAADTLGNQESIQLSPTVELVGWEFRNDTAHVAVSVDRRPSTVLMADGVAGAGQAGSTRVPTVEETVLPGDTTIVRMPVESFEGDHMVTVGTTTGQESVRLSTGLEPASDDPLRHFGGESGLFWGMLMSIGMAFGAGAFVVWREDSGVKKA